MPDFEARQRLMQGFGVGTGGGCLGVLKYILSLIFVIVVSGALFKLVNSSWLGNMINSDNMFVQMIGIWILGGSIVLGFFGLLGLAFVGIRIAKNSKKKS